MSAKRSLAEQPPLKYLLECSDNALGNFELAKLGDVANLGSEMLALFDRMVDVSAQAVLAALLRTIDRNEIRRELLESPDATINRVIAEAKTEIRSQGCPEELEDGPMPNPSFLRKLPPEKLTAGAWTRISAGRNTRSQRASVAGAQRRSAVNSLSTGRNTSQ